MIMSTQVVEGGSPGTTQLTVRGKITAAGATVDHVQYLSERFVLTEMGTTTTIHAAELGGRFVVDTASQRLRRVTTSPDDIQISHLREIIGEVDIHRDPVMVERSGFICRRYRVCNDSTRIVISAEAFCARIDAVGRTALHAERMFEAALHPLALPLDPDELVIGSTTRTYANNYQHLQSYTLTSLTETIEDPERIQAYLSFPVETDGMS
ncbi:MAG: hypothetical protein LBG44_11085 [Gemmatimonadota bacterium]|jgi:hypothetical protein|nr:hypothetical protein [Gemmatimonadota bacterium]